MKRFAYILCAVLFLCGCQEQNTPVVAVMVDFQINRTSAPLMYQFVNRSSGVSDFRWDFGDGTWSNDKNAMHEYEKTGTYTVTLTASAYGQRFTHTERLIVTEPECYIAGYVLYHIPYENRYYKVIFKDDNLLPSDWDFQTVYTPLLDNTYLPYTRVWITPKHMDDLDTHTYYTVQVMRNTSTADASADVSCMRQQLKVKTIKTYQPEYILQTETGTTAIGVLMEYR